MTKLTWWMRRHSANFAGEKSENEVVSGPRTTGDGYYESCVVVIEGNQIEITV